MISWPIWIELRSFLHPNLQRYCQEKLLFHPLLTKNENLINWNKKSFFGERGLASTLPLPLPTHGCFSTVLERQVKTASLRVTSGYFRCSTFRAWTWILTAFQTHQLFRKKKAKELSSSSRGCLNWSDNNHNKIKLLLNLSSEFPQE